MIVRNLLLCTLAAVALALVVSPSAASVVSFDITPQSPTQGDIVRITGTASPAEEVPVTISFEQVLSATGDRYEWRLYSVDIPEGRNQFTVTAQVVNNMKVSLKVWGIWITNSADSANGVATLRQSDVPPGTYDVLIAGSSNSNTVRITVEAKTFLTADTNGKFAYSYDTSPIPPGEFIVTVGSVTKTIELQKPTNTGSAGGAASGGVVSPLPSSSTPSVSPTPSSTPTSSSNPPVSPTPPPAPTGIPQPIPSPSPLHPMTPSPATAKPLRIPGFELVGSFVALIIICMLRRSSEKCSLIPGARW